MALASDVWFENGCHVWKPPQDVKREHEKFKARLSRLLKFKKRGVELASTEEQLRAQIDHATADHSSAIGTLAAGELGEAVKVQDTYQQQRQKGARKVGNKIQRGLSTFAEFVSAYSSILNAVAEAGGPYAQVGYQTLSILLIVFVNKTKNDDSLLEHIDKIRKSIAKLDSWETIYRTDDMRGLVSSAYGHVIEFSRSAAEYFSSFWRRFWLALNPVATVEFNVIATSIYQTLAEINAEAMYGLHQRSQNIETQIHSLKASEQRAQQDRQTLLAQNEGLKQQVEEHRKRFEERERQDDGRRMEAFQELLGVHLPHPGTDLTSTKNALMTVFPTVGKLSPGIPYTGYLQMSETLLLELDKYQDWRKSSASGLLFLSGKTAYQGRKLMGCSHCWISPAAIYLAEDLGKENKNVAFFSCQPGLRSSTASARTILAAIIIQILQWKPHILREKFGDFKRILASPQGSSAPVKPLIDLLTELLSAMKDLGGIYIIVDRIDCCDVDIDLVMNELARLVSIIGSPSFQLKIAVTAETSGGRGDWRLGFLSNWEYDLARIFEQRDWDQRRLTSVESSARFRPSIWTANQTMTEMEFGEFADRPRLETLPTW